MTLDPAAMQSTVDANSDAKGTPPPGVERPAADRDTHLGPGNGGGSSGAGPHAARSHAPSDNTHQSDGHVQFINQYKSLCLCHFSKMMK